MERTGFRTASHWSLSYMTRRTVIPLIRNPVTAKGHEYPQNCLTFSLSRIYERDRDWIHTSNDMPSRRSK